MKNFIILFICISINCLAENHTKIDYVNSLSNSLTYNCDEDYAFSFEDMRCINDNLYIKLIAFSQSSADFIKLRFYENQEKQVYFDLTTQKCLIYCEQSLFIHLLDIDKNVLYKHEVQWQYKNQYDFHGVFKMELEDFLKIRYFHISYEDMTKYKPK